MRIQAVEAEHQSAALYSVHNLFIKHQCSPVNKSSTHSASAQPSPTAAIAVIFIKYFITQSISFMMGILILSVTSSNSGSANMLLDSSSFVCGLDAVFLSFSLLSSAQTHKWKLYFIYLFSTALLQCFVILQTSWTASHSELPFVNAQQGHNHNSLTAPQITSCVCTNLTFRNSCLNSFWPPKRCRAVRVKARRGDVSV